MEVFPLVPVEKENQMVEVNQKLKIQEILALEEETAMEVLRNP